jgi:GntR family transcriptional repressor for pyruvate dehydrogenase complex
MPKPVVRQPLPRQVLQSLVNSIAARRLGPEDRLPTERELAAELGVSRNTVREALGSLEAIGAVTRSPKRGAVLKPVDFSALAQVSQVFLLRSAADFAELLDARRAFEIGLLPLVAAQATADDFERMEAANRVIESEVAAGWLPVEGDLAFHLAVLNASHNRFLIQFGKLLEAFFRAAEPRIVPNESLYQRTLKEHRQLIRALSTGNARRAQRLLEQHLNPPPTAERTACQRKSSRGKPQR